MGVDAKKLTIGVSGLLKDKAITSDTAAAFSNAIPTLYPTNNGSVNE